jgi:hypothetical protein
MVITISLRDREWLFFFSMLDIFRLVFVSMTIAMIEWRSGTTTWTEYDREGLCKWFCDPDSDTTPASVCSGTYEAWVIDAALSAARRAVRVPSSSCENVSYSVWRSIIRRFINRYPARRALASPPKEIAGTLSPRLSVQFVWSKSTLITDEFVAKYYSDWQNDRKAMVEFFNVCVYRQAILEVID